MSQIPADPGPGGSLAEEVATGRPLRPVLVWALALTAGLIAGFASWLIGESIHGRFAPPDARTSHRLSPDRSNRDGRRLMPHWCWRGPSPSGRWAR